MGIYCFSEIFPVVNLWIMLVLLFRSCSIRGEPVMSFPDSGVYSLFPNEDLRTGKSTRPLPPLQEQRLDRRFQESFPRRYTYEPNSGFHNRRGRILFDDERLNVRGHFDPTPSRERVTYSSGERFHERYRVIPAYGEAKLPPGAISEEPTRIHVFNAETPQKSPHIPLSLDSAVESVVKPGRLFIPSSRNPFIDLRDPGPDAFINHDQFLEYHTNAAIATLQSKERGRPCDTESRRLLFSSPNIRGLIPPSTESSSSSSESNEPEVESLEEKVHVTSLLETPRLESVKTPFLESGFIPIHIPSRYKNKNDEEEPSRTHINVHQPEYQKPPPTIRILSTTEAPSTTESTMETTTTKTTRKGRVYPYVKKSSTTPGHITRIKQRPTENNGQGKGGGAYSDSESETITFAPNSFEDFVERRGSAEFAATKIRTEVPLIFLESQEFDVGNQKNAIFVKRLKNSKNFDLPENSGTMGKGGVASKSVIESTMTVHSAEISSFEMLGRPPLNSDEVKLQSSVSNHGIVAEVHAHVSHCPKLHAGAEIICDVHIRKRHGAPNPQLTVGWKRKFHNATKEDLVLAVNTTLAYIEEDFHDKFNVTIAPGINPMLRSVLSIRHVEPADTGNYECQVNDGQNILRSDTLLFLCH